MHERQTPEFGSQIMALGGGPFYFAFQQYGFISTVHGQGLACNFPSVTAQIKHSLGRDMVTTVTLDRQLFVACDIF